MTTKPLYIFDLDGTLALIDHRRHFVEGPRAQQNWHAFFAACVDDAPNRAVIQTFNMLKRAGADILIFSGRSDKVRHQTEAWLLKHVDEITGADLEGPMLRMRKAGDYTPDDALKGQWFEEMLPCDAERLVAVFDDRDRVVRIWRDLGVPCFQVAEGAF